MRAWFNKQNSAFSVTRFTFRVRVQVESWTPRDRQPRLKEVLITLLYIAISQYPDNGNKHQSTYF